MNNIQTLVWQPFSARALNKNGDGYAQYCECYSFYAPLVHIIRNARQLLAKSRKFTVPVVQNGFPKSPKYVFTRIWSTTSYLYYILNDIYIGKRCRIARPKGNGR